MTRIIKFRCWDKVQAKMFEPSSISWKNGSMWVCDAHGDNKLEYEMVHPNAEIMQFTGLLDKNGKEIYEGDIVRFPKSEEYHAELAAKYEITLQEVLKAEAGDKTFLHPNGCFNGGSQGFWESYYLSHRSNKTKENPEGKLSGTIRRYIERTLITTNMLVEWKEITGSEEGRLGYGFNDLTDAEIIGNIYQDSHLLESK